MAVNFLTLRSAVANDIAVQHLTYSTMVGHPTASHQTVQAIITSSIMTMGHVGIGATAALSGTALHVVGSTMISGNVSIVGGATGDPLRVNNNKTTGDDTPSFILRNNQTIPSQLGFILKTASAGIYHTLVQTGDHLLLSFDQNNGVAGANGIVIGGRSQTAGLRIGTTSSAFNGDLAISGNITINNGVGGTLTKIGSTVGYYATFTGGTADNSPFLEFWAGGSRRCYMGNANTTEVQFASENGAQLKFLTGGTSRLTIASGGDITASSNLTANCLIVNGGGTYQAGCIYSDANWGMLFRAKVVPSTGGGIFGWYDSAGTEKMKMLTDGSLFLSKPAGGPGFVQTDGTIIVETWIGGAGGWYGTRTNHPLRFYTNNSSARMTINTDGDVTVSKRLILDGTGATEIYNGLIDAYNSTGNNNLMIKSWWGIGFSSYDNIVRIGMDTRTGSADFVGNVTIGGDFKKTGGSSGKNWFSIRGTDPNNSPYLEFFVDNARRCYMGFATTTRMYIMAENGVALAFGSGGAERMIVDTTGYVAIGNFTPTYKLHVGGADGNIRAEGSIYCDRYLSTSSSQRIDLDTGNVVNWISNTSGPKPISFGPTTWANGGYTVISMSQTLNGVGSAGLGLGNSSHNEGGRSVIVSLAPGYAWGELILSGSYIYTCCYGTINNYTNGGGWVYISDQRCKKDIKDIKTIRSLERIMALKPKTYKKIYPENPETPVPKEVEEADHIGFLAQDVMETNPHCISEWVDENYISDDDDGKRLGIAYGDINVHLVGAVQELKKQNDAQQKEIDELKQQLVTVLQILNGSK